MSGKFQTEKKSPRSSGLAPAGLLQQRKCACGGTPGPKGECEACGKKKLQRRIGDSSNEPSPSATLEAPPIVYEVLRSPGASLDASTREVMQLQFGHDFSRVRVHTDAQAAMSARAVNALAYTIGHSVIFGLGQYAPGTIDGKRLLAHELVHVVQQGNDDATLVSPSTRIAPADSPAESEANSAAAQFSGHRSIAPEIKRYATAIRLQKAPGKCSTTVTINCTDEDLLTAVCIGEAGNIIDTDGKKGVMNVVMNRVAEGGGSLRSVATAPGQFQGLNNGIKHLNDSSFAACRPLAQEVMASPAQDPTAGAVFFDQSCSKPCTEYCTVYLGDGKTNAHYFARRARPTEEKDCKNRKLNPTARNRHCCLAPKQRMYVLPELTITPGDEEAKKVETKDSTKSRGAPTPLVPNQL